MSDLSYPDPKDMLNTTVELDAATKAIQTAVRTQVGLLNAARIVVALAEVVAKGSGVPLGSVAADVARVALDLASKERT